ncbi:MAG TPA: PepSY domain-containing protein [Xanthobacteraceae bacterium]
MIKLSLLTAAAILATASVAAAGSLGRPCTSEPQSTWLAMEALQSKVEALGYQVRNAKLKNACGEFYVTDKSGARVELFVDPTNGSVVGRQ